MSSALEKHWQVGDPGIHKEIQALHKARVYTITWKADKQACDPCAANDGQTVAVGRPFASGAMIPPEHDHCRCSYKDDAGRVWSWTGKDGEYTEATT